MNAPANGRKAKPANKPQPGDASPQAYGAKPAEPDNEGNAERGERIAKWLGRAGVASRRDAEKIIAEGRVKLGGKLVTQPATFVQPHDIVTVDGQAVNEPERTRLFRFHKPAGFLTTARDPGGRPTIMDILPEGLPRVVPVGRLDMNTEGLLLLTTDGALKRALELPTSGVPRRYRVRAYGEISQPAIENLIHGLTIDGMRYGPIDAEIERLKTDIRRLTPGSVDPDYVEALARDKLAFVYPGEIVLLTADASSAK